MSPEATCYRGVIIRAVTGTRPALIFSVADDTKLTALCEQLARAEKVADLLQHKGYGNAGLDIVDIVASLPDKSHEQHQTTKGAQTRSKG
jgi:hypothetical protein